MILVPIRTRRFQSLLSPLLLLLMGALVLGGCGEETASNPPDGPGDPTTGGGETTGGETTGDEEPPEPSLSLLIPEESTPGPNGTMKVVAGNDASLAVKVDHVKLVEPTEGAEHVEGEGYIALYVSSPIPKNKVYEGVGATQEADDSAIILQFPVPYDTPSGVVQLFGRILNNDGTYSGGSNTQDTLTLDVEIGSQPITIAFETPTEGTVVSPGETLSLALDVSGLTFVDPGSKSENVQGEGYIAIHMDDAAEDEPLLELTETTAEIPFDSDLAP